MHSSWAANTLQRLHLNESPPWDWVTLWKATERSELAVDPLSLTSLSFAGLYGPRVPCQKEGICWHCLQLQTVTIALTVFSFSPMHFPMGYRDHLVLSLLFCCAFYGKLLLLPNKRAKLHGPSTVRSAGSFVIIIEMHYSHGHYKGQERWMLRPPRKHTFTCSINNNTTHHYMTYIWSVGYRVYA